MRLSLEAERVSVRLVLPARQTTFSSFQADELAHYGRVAGQFSQFLQS
jgi:hypothetical protein